MRQEEIRSITRDVRVLCVYDNLILLIQNRAGRRVSRASALCKSWQNRRSKSPSMMARHYVGTRNGGARVGGLAGLR